MYLTAEELGTDVTKHVLMEMLWLTDLTALLFFFVIVLVSCNVLSVCLWPRLCRARAIGYRQHNQEAVGGFFSQIGNLYMVHHLWGRNSWFLLTLGTEWDSIQPISTAFILCTLMKIPSTVSCDFWEFWRPSSKSIVDSQFATTVSWQWEVVLQPTKLLTWLATRLLGNRPFITWRIKIWKSSRNVVNANMPE